MTQTVNSTVTAMSTPDPARVEEQAGKIFGYMAGAVVSVGVWLGDQLGLYRAVARAGPVTSAELAQRMGLSERWIQEWLAQHASAGLLAYHEGRFEISPESALILADESTPASGIGMFGFLASMFEIAGDLPECFRTGLGRKYDAHGRKMAEGMQRATAPTIGVFTDAAIPSLDGMVAKLERGARVADIGCGAGGRLIALAQRYPELRFSRLRHLGSRARASAGKSCERSNSERAIP